MIGSSTLKYSTAPGITCFSKIYLEFLNTKENQMIEKLQELKRPETKILAKVI